ncbi:MAG: M36 family metallopeptidase, partial [Akkermansiaceae bacterium]|nr:M36 family metallopeptidase [Verrucomicrobiales bacterium]
MKKIAFLINLTVVMAFAATVAFADGPSGKPELPNFDKRTAVTNAVSPAKAVGLDPRKAAHDQLRARLPEVSVDTDPIVGSPKYISSNRGFLSGAAGTGGAVPAVAVEAIPATDTNRAVKAFLNEYQGLFGHNATVLDAAKVERDYVDAHNGMRTTVWRQQLDGIDLFEGILKAHVTKKGELINLASHFIADPTAAADKAVGDRAAVLANPPISAAQAVANAGQNVGEQLSVEAVAPKDAEPEGSQRRQQFTAPGLNEATAKLVWLPMDGTTLRLCWDVLLVSRSRGEMFTVLVDAQTGEAVVRICRTAYATPASYRVFTSDSPTPFSPGWSTPNTNQPAQVARSLVTLTSISDFASPNGWINDGVSNTIGNNVDAHLDWDNDNVADPGSRPIGTNRVFDFPLNLTQEPSTYSNAAVVQLFYLNNFMHDKLYDLGFTEAAGNFQTTNFGRGGLDNDAVQADAQDGILVGRANNANFSTPGDGSPPRMQMFLWNGPTPDIDGDFDAEVVLHEYTHGLSTRLVGGGVGISASQTRGMGEGWGDFYGIALLAEAGDNVNGCWARGGYSRTGISGPTFANYYFGGRRYPYSTQLSKNPLTFKDIDPTQASSHAGIPSSPIVGGTADEVHNAGEVWCATLWEARANLITKYGFPGNQLMLQLVTDGMKLSPVNPNFLQARDAILQADLIHNEGANLLELWQAFAKRGMGNSATSSVATANLVFEAFDLPPYIELAVAVDAPTLTWNSGGTANWFTQTAITHDSGDAAQSGDVADNQSSYLETTITGPGTLTFWWKVSSEPTHDKLLFAMDGNTSNSIAGVVDWQPITATVPAGSHTLRWTYSKDFSISANADAGWVDQISFAPPLAVALDATNLTWTTGGSANWAGQIGTTRDSVDAAQSGAITNSQTSYMETTVVGPGVVSFWWKVSSELGYDFLYFSLDGNISNSISGSVNWQLASYAVPVGSHTLRWTYTKDFTFSVGADAGWVDQVAVWPSMVTVTNDSGPGSLRQMIADLPEGHTITFAPNLSGATITLTTGQIPLSRDCTLDASALPGGIIISGNGASRAFYVQPGVTTVLNNLTITNCNAATAPQLAGYGGGILMEGELNLTNCTLANNSASILGGAILIRANRAATFENCTLLQNSAPTGGAIMDEGNLTANNSTFWGNTGTTSGGAIGLSSTATAILNFCTVSSNSSPVGSGLDLPANAALTTISNSIIAANSGSSSNIAGAFTPKGVNLTNGNPL